MARLLPVISCRYFSHHLEKCHGGNDVMSAEEMKYRSKAGEKAAAMVIIEKPGKYRRREHVAGPAK